jgi:YVTN family beta-propeller protein
VIGTPKPQVREHLAREERKDAVKPFMQTRRYRGAFICVALASVVLLGGTASSQDAARVGDEVAGGTVVATGQIIRPVGESVSFGGRPVDLVVSPDAKFVYAKENTGLVVIDAATWKVRKELNFPKGGASMHGIALSPDGTEVYLTSARNEVYVAKVDGAGGAEWSRTFTLTGPKGTAADDDPAHLTGIAISADGARAYVCASRNNTLAVIDLRAPDAAAALSRHIAVGVAPFDVVLSPDGDTAYVSDWGGRRPRAGERTGASSGTQVVVDERGVGASGAVSIVDLKAGRETAIVETGLHASDLALSRDGKTLYVANANSDTVSVIDTTAHGVTQTISLRPDPALPFGSAPNALALDEGHGLLYVANGGNNAVAVVSLAGGAPPRVTGFIPGGWYPGALALAGDALYIANVKGEGSRTRFEEGKGWSVRWFKGTVQRVSAPIDAATLADYTKRVMQDGYTPHALAMRERSTAAGVPPVPVPAKLGEPSVFEHVVYIIKENRTYDQVFSDLTRGNNDPALCTYPREVTPNHHALAEDFALLDNYYCNGVVSADGHEWATEGYVTDHLEKAFGGFTRSYTFGDDALTYSSSGFIWDQVLAAGLSFRNYGEMNYSTILPEKTSFKEVYDDFVKGGNTTVLTHRIGPARLAEYSSQTYPGWNLNIPDVLRASVFLKELAGFEKSGQFPNFVILYLPNDHTSGIDSGTPTPAAHVADNDLALGRVIEGISRSRFWPKTCIFVNEDDPQDGFDHVDGHRSLCLVVSPYTKRGAVVSKFYNQTSVLHTISRILGLPPMNQIDANSPLMFDVFTGRPHLDSYTARKNNVPLDLLNPPKTALRGEALHWARKSAKQDFAKIDAADEDTLNRILWFAAKGPGAKYPSELAGAHGKGLKDLDLVLTRDGAADDD